MSCTQSALCEPPQDHKMGRYVRKCWLGALFFSYVACWVGFLVVPRQAKAASARCNFYAQPFLESFTSPSTQNNYRSTVMGWGSGRQINLSYKTGVFPPSSSNPRYGSLGQRILAAGDGQGNITHQGTDEMAALVSSPLCQVAWFARSNDSGTYTGSYLNPSYTYVVDPNAVCGEAPAVAVNDVDGNGMYDIVVISVTQAAQQGTVQSGKLYLNMGSGYSFVTQDITAMLNQANVAWHANGTPIRLEDINSDGHADLLVVSSHGNVSQVLCFLAAPPGQPPGFVSPPIVLLPDTHFTRPFADTGVTATSNIGNGNNYDGFPCINSGSGGVNVGPTGMAFEDFNGDGYFDLILTSPSETNAKVFFNNGDNTFTQARDIFFNGGGPSFAYAFDYDGDGTVDLGLLRSGNGCLLGSPGIWVLPNPANDANFVPQTTPNLPVPDSIIDWAAATKQQIISTDAATAGTPANYFFGFVTGKQVQTGNYTEWYNVPASAAYNLAGQAQSVVMYSGISTHQSLAYVTLNGYTRSNHYGTKVGLCVSPDGGTHWEGCVEDLESYGHIFTTFGQQFVWRATLTAPAVLQTGVDAAYNPAASNTPIIDLIGFVVYSTDPQIYSRSNLAYGVIGSGSLTSVPYVYSSTFDYPGFWGHLTATSLANTTAGNSNSLQTVITPPAWDAGAILATRTGTTRNLYAGYPGAAQQVYGSTSVTSTTRINFNVSELTAGAGKNPNLVQLLNVASSKASLYLGSIRDGYNDPQGQKFYNPGHSSPVFVGPPSQDANYMGPGYNAFMSSQSTRAPFLLQGANDGMLHSFDAATGVENWGLVPYNLLGKLQNNVSFTGTNNAMVFGHDFFVDGPITVADILVGSAWHTVAIYGQGQGQGFNKNNYYSAVDITTPASPSPLWEMTETYSGVNSLCSGDPCAGYAMTPACSTFLYAFPNYNCSYNGEFFVDRSIGSSNVDIGYSAGLIEAEHFSRMTGSTTYPQDNWNTIVTATPYVSSARNNAYIQSQGPTANCPGTTTAAKQACTQVSYLFEIQTGLGGTYYPLFLVNVAGGQNSTLAWGIDGTYQWSGTLQPIDGGSPWSWASAGSVALIDGIHELNVWMVDTNVALDAIALQTQASTPPPASFPETPLWLPQTTCNPTYGPTCVSNPSSSEWPECGPGLGLKCCTSGASNYCYPMGSSCPPTPPSIMGETFSAPAIARLNTSSGDKWVAFFASGYSTFKATDVGRSVYAVDAFTGAVMATWNFADVTAPPINPTILTTIPAAVSLVDMDSDGYVDRVYVGDLAGRMWKIDTSKQVSLNNGQLVNPADYPTCVVFDAGDAQQTGNRTWAPIITKAATVVFDSNTVNVYFGTGGDGNAPVTQNYVFYSVRDLDIKGQCVTRNRSASSLTLSNAEWSITDPNQGYKFYADPTVVNGSAVYFSSYAGDTESVTPCANAAAMAGLYGFTSSVEGSNVYGVAVRNFKASDGSSYTAGSSVLGGGRSSLSAQGMIRTGAVQAGVAPSQVTRQIKSYSAAPTDLYFQQNSGEILRLSASGALPTSPLRVLRWRVISF